MSEQRKPDDRDDDGEGGRRRKPYVKPAFVREQLFETMALACGKVQTTQAQCRTNRKNS